MLQIESNKVFSPIMLNYKINLCFGQIEVENTHIKHRQPQDYGMEFELKL